MRIERQESFKTTARAAARANTAASRPYITGDSDAAHALRQMAALAASCDMPLLISGPYGSGKEHVARYIHAESKRRHGPFLKLHCGSDSAQAVNDDGGGSIETAEGGTLYLSDADKMSIDVQTLIFQLIEQRNMPPANARSRQPLNIRVIAASSRCLASMVSDGTFRQDLYCRLNMLALPVPPLRQRLPAHILELRKSRPLNADFNLKSHLEAEELQLLASALRQVNGVVQHAADLSGLKRTTFIEKMRKHGIDGRQFRR